MDHRVGLTGRAQPALTTVRKFSLELLVVLAAVLVYFGVRGITAVNVAVAYEHAADLTAFEKSLGLFVEDSFQDVVAPSQTAIMVMNWVYIWGHWPVIAAVLVWLFLTRHDGYKEIRAAMILSGAVGLVIFAAYPVAPPRLADPEIMDTVSQHSPAYRVLQPPALVNQYAAMPSLHVGWDLLMGYALVRYGRRRWQRVAGVLLPFMMMVAVVATGNHYVVDAVAGVLLVLAGLLLVRYVQARLARRSRRSHGPSRSVPTQRESPGHEPSSSPVQVYDRR